MFGVVGLGNPGSRYAFTPHNVGFMVCDLLSIFFSFYFRSDSAIRGLVGRFELDGEDVLVLKPLTYMNASGVSVRAFVSHYGIQPDRLIVVHDDIDMPLGRIRIKKNSSSGGHRGVASVIELLGTQDFIRVKLGIGRKGDDAAKYVLSEFDKEDLPIVREMVDKAREAVVDIMRNGLQHAMSTYNKKA